MEGVEGPGAEDQLRLCRVLHERYKRCVAGSAGNILLSPKQGPKEVCAAAFADLRQRCHEHFRSGALLRDAPASG